MNEDTTDLGTGAGDASRLLGLEGLVVVAVSRREDGSRLVEVVTAPDAQEAAAACPGCAVVSVQAKEWVITRPRDVRLGAERLDLRWRKRRWYCREKRCQIRAFTECLPSVGHRSRLTSRLRAQAGDLVVDGVCSSVSAAARSCGLSWPVVMDSVREQADRAGLLEGPADAVSVLGMDEVRRGRPRWRPPSTQDIAPTSAGVPETVPSEPVTDAGPTPQRGDECSRARTLADRWHVGFTDITGGAGMLAQIEGRTSDDVAYWLATQTPAWRHRIQFVAIDMCTIFVSAIRRYLPAAQIIVDRFHVVKLATDTVTEVRRRITMTRRGRRGRKNDPEWAIRNLLGRNRENLSPKAFAKIWNTLVELGNDGVTILKAWIAKDLLRQVLALTPSGPPDSGHAVPDRSRISQRLTKFYTWCADANIPELDRLATTIDTWWDGIHNAITSGHSNAASEGYNRVVKLDARNAYGYRNPDNQRLRTRCATTRRKRGCLNPG
ncbi:transposase [Kineosporia babensis]|uniref:Transposase n=1 Tax=Kineosporia babensis TaxID=499548 RepID=A0A9X1NPK0_9ACTN|nr:transposase [Kineosporia babensis]MCD5317284.1 transposase [Kineosporia babensis]